MKIMYKISKMILILMIIGLTSGLFSACGSSGTADGQGTTEQTTDNKNQETDEIEDAAGDGEINTIENGSDLIDYYGMNIDDVVIDFPDLQYDNSYKTGDEITEVSVPADKMERMSDGVALAGPFFLIDQKGTVVGINYGGLTYCICKVSVGMPMSEAADLVKSQGFQFADVEIAHGTAKYVAIYDNGEIQLSITSDADGDFGKTEESDVTGNVDCIMINSLKEHTEVGTTVKGAPEIQDIYRKYQDIVSESDQKKWDGFALIDLDDDGVCELFATCINGEREDESMQPYMIVGHNNDEPVINDELQDGVAGAGGYRGTLYYLEGKGILHESMTFAPFGLPADNIYVLNNGKLEISDQGEFSIDSYNGQEDEEWDPLEHGSWNWNGQTVTEEEYKEKIKEATRATEGFPVCEIEWKDRDTIQKELSEIIQ